MSLLEGVDLGAIVISVIVPVRNRTELLDETLATLRRQSLPASAYEIIVIDDGSTPPVSLKKSCSAAMFTLLRLEGRERSAARNAGAEVAKGDLVVFIDDDITVCPGFLEAHLVAHREWETALIVGAIHLPKGTVRHPFGLFRQALERQGSPSQRGITRSRNFCTAANMSMERRQFLGLGGFDEELVSGEDQDLALRHSAAGGAIVFLPEAVGIHRDEAMDVRSYCRRVEWGSRHMVAFCRKHPAWPDNMAREQVNGPLRCGREPVAQSARKLGKKVAGLRPILEVCFAATAVVERVAPGSPVLERLYRLLLGVHIYRGYRHGASRWIGRKPVVVSDASPKGG